MRNKNIIKIILQIIVLGLFLIGALYLAKQATTNIELQSIGVSYGYMGMFFISVVSGFNILVPIPIITLLPFFIASGLSFWLSIVVISLGLTTGDSIGYLIGHIGRDAIKVGGNKSGIVTKLEYVRVRYPRGLYIIMFFYASLVPFPNEILVIPLAFLGYKLRYIFPIVFVGNFVFNMLSGYGISSIFSLISAL